MERWGDHVFAALRGEHRDVLYDRVRQPMWRGTPDPGPGGTTPGPGAGDEDPARVAPGGPG